MWHTDKMMGRMQDLSPHMQSSFMHLVDEMYDQESDSMIRFIEESRRQLQMIGYEFNSEQEALRQTGDHLSATSRMSDTSSKLSIRSESAHRRPPNSAGHRSPCGSSLDSVSFESEQSSAKKSRGRTKSSLGIALRPSSRQVSPMPSPRYNQQAPITSQTTRCRDENLARNTPSPIQHFAVAGRTPSNETAEWSPADDVYDSTKEYEEEKEKIMKNMSGVQQTLERERTRQNMKAQERRERKKEKTIDMANKMVREASALEEMKMRDQRRQEDVLKQRLEMKKRQREKSDLVSRSLTHRPASDLGMDNRNLGFLTERPGTASTCTASTSDPIDFDINNPLKPKKSNKKSRENIPEAWGLGGDDEEGDEVKKKSKKKKKSKDKDKEQSFELEETMNSDSFEAGKHKKKSKKKDKELEGDDTEEPEDKDEDDVKAKKKKKKRNKDKDIRETASLDML